MLVYPLTDADMGTQSMRKYTDTPFWDSTYMSLMWDIYFGDQNKGAFEDKTGCALKDDLKKEALPMHNALPSSIPDTYIETAEFDCLHDEGTRNLTAFTMKGFCTDKDWKRQAQRWNGMTRKVPFTVMIWPLIPGS